MPPEYKSVPHFTKSIDGRTVTGIFAVHGNVDEGRDRSHPGAFADTAIKGRDRVRFLWQHGSFDPPVAVVNGIRELTAAELPDSVKSYAPDATGGAEVTRTYLDTPRGSEVLAGLQAGAIEEMSYAYDIVEWKITQPEDETQPPIRELYKLRLWDISDVNWGMNPATSAIKGLPLHIEHDTVLATVQSYIDRLEGLAALRAKEGRVLSGDNRKRVEACLEALEAATSALKDLLAASEPKTHDRQDIRRLWLETQRTLAQLNGVPTR